MPHDGTGGAAPATGDVKEAEECVDEEDEVLAIVIRHEIGKTLRAHVPRILTMISDLPLDQLIRNPNFANVSGRAVSNNAMAIACLLATP